ncbi:MAG TPA: hypothetical protein PKA64_07510 [Myxococcota bacterium]|nr:hypothetical protein [Myxococcota bacterium]
MRIRNRAGQAISYEIRGGPLRMTLSTCELEPGEDETWSARYGVGEVACEVIVEAGDARAVVRAGADATLTVRDDGGLRVEVG